MVADVGPSVSPSVHQLIVRPMIISKTKQDRPIVTAEVTISKLVLLILLPHAFKLFKQINNLLYNC